MHLISSRLKKFDVHVKTVDVANEQTIVGAVITLLCVAVTVLLIISEITLYMSKDVVHHLVVDQGGMGHDTVRLDFEFEFPKLACKGVFFLFIGHPFSYSTSFRLVIFTRGRSRNCPCT